MKGRKVLLLCLMDEGEAVSDFLPTGKERKEATVVQWRKATKMSRERLEEIANDGGGEQMQICSAAAAAAQFGTSVLLLCLAKEKLLSGGGRQRR
ncbi:hypothetical protein SLEP1_g3158 [Rubroshorea leprosula]|uniref:Uncharacterized protein n=1 Tax=Rubroshorea leprosula TaxID=152421 RepID=A0AAV5HJX0_9ROSI|nr:hypothetical protein SLEP1_g3158 [Rubroshorea leprosula]